MAAYNIYEAKTHLSSLIEKAATGEEVVIARAGKPVARLISLVNVQPAMAPPQFYRKRAGFARGMFTDLIAEMDKPWPEDIQRAFEMID